MSLLSQPKSESLRLLYWRDEILQLLFWIEGEGFGQQVEVVMLERFLGLDAETARALLQHLSEEGLLDRSGLEGYQLSERGRGEAARIFSQEFAGLTQPAHGACGPECWCRTSTVEAVACEADRRSWAIPR